MFRWIGNLFSSRTPGAADARSRRLVRARYDAASTTDDNRRHWAAADGLSASAANSPRVRRVLRNRARYEVANNSYARGIVLTLANDVVGTGPRLQIQTSDTDANKRIETEFMRWADAVSLAEKLRTMRMARAQDGEAFAVLTSNPRLPTRVTLDLKLVEADQVTTPDLNPLAPNAVDGIVFDEAGNPIEYHILKYHPGDARLPVVAVRDYDRVPAEAVIHWFRMDRPGQVRGIPDITPALPLFAQLRRFTLAVLAAAETAADFVGILYTDAPASGEADAAEPFEPIELEKRALLTMPGGWKMSQLEAEQPTTRNLRHFQVGRGVANPVMGQGEARGPFRRREASAERPGYLTGPFLIKASSVSGSVNSILIKSPRARPQLLNPRSFRIACRISSINRRTLGSDCWPMRRNVP